MKYGPLNDIVTTSGLSFTLTFDLLCCKDNLEAGNESDMKVVDHRLDNRFPTLKAQAARTDCVARLALDDRIDGFHLPALLDAVPWHVSILLCQVVRQSFSAGQVPLTPPGLLAPK